MRKSSPDSARRRQLATSLNEFLAKPTLGKALQLLARHPELLGNFVIEWLRLMRRVLRNRTRAREELLRSLPEAVDEKSLARIRRWSEDSERVGDTETSRLFSQTAFKMTSLRDQMTRAANKLYDRSVVEMLFAVGSARNEHEAFDRVQQNIQIAFDHNFIPALMQVRHQLLQWREAPPDVEQVVIATMRLVHSTLLERTTTEIGVGGI